MPSTLIGRKEEQLILKEALNSPEAEMVAVIGRWRVGKTYLVTSVYENQIAFSVTGIQNGALEDQLGRFSKSMKKYSGAKIDLPIPKNWFEAFDLLQQYIETLAENRKHSLNQKNKQ